MQQIEYITLVENSLSLFITVFILPSIMHKRLNKRTNNEKRSVLNKIKLTILFGENDVYAKSEPEFASQ